MNLEVKIVNEFGWFRFNDIFWSIGYIYDENNIALKGRDLYNYLKPILENKELLESTLKKINGSFLIVAKISPQIIIITDKVCSYRVFYHLNENSFAISDKLIYLKNQYNCPVDNLSIEEFLSCGFVTGRESLFGNIYQTRGGEMIYIENCKIDIKSYFHSRKETLKEEKLDTYRNNYQNILSNICERLQKNSEDKQYVLSLSGGYDSRLIASLLKKSGVNNVICFTYGKKNSYELELSRKITNTLGFNLVEIVYTDDFLHN